MTLERVLYTATAHTTAGRDGGGRRARRSVLTTWAAAGAFGLVLLAAPCDAQTATQRETTVAQTEITTGAIRPFRVNIPEAALVDLRQRVLATRWPEKETVNDQSQGVRLEKIQALVHYWGTSYDWRKIEAKLNALPQFVTTIDGLDIHFIHVRSRHPKAMPLIITHGWPGSVLEIVKAIGPLTDPTAYGGRAEDAFDVVIPSMPGYGFSGKPQSTGWGPDRIGLAWDVLMKRLGYKRYVSQGGDWGSVVADAMARQAPAGLLGIHVNMPANRASRRREGHPRRRSGAGRIVAQGEGRVRLVEHVLQRRTRDTAQ